MNMLPSPRRGGVAVMIECQPRVETIIDDHGQALNELEYRFAGSKSVRVRARVARLYSMCHSKTYLRLSRSHHLNALDKQTPRDLHSAPTTRLTATAGQSS